MIPYNNRCDNDSMMLDILIIDVPNILCLLKILYIENIIQVELSHHIEKSSVKKIIFEAFKCHKH